MIDSAPATDTLQARVHSALEASPYIPFQKMRVEAEHGSVRIQGNVGSFFEKQMTQEVVRRLDGVEQVENLLEVSWG